MLSKEEYTPIELRKHCIKTMQFSNRDSSAYKEHELTLSIMDENISMKYKIDNLESDKQKLIEKLEEDKKIFGNYEERKQMAKEQLYENDGKWFYCQEILSILKGGNRE